MSRYAAILIILVGAVYLIFGIAASVFPAMFLVAVLHAPRSAPIAADSLVFLGYTLVTVGPCYLIVYALVRHKKWGRYLLICYNSSWLAYLTYAFVTRFITNPKSVSGPAVVPAMVAFLILGGLIALISQKDVKALLSY